MFKFLTKTIYRKLFLLILFVSIVPAAVGILLTNLQIQVAMDSTIGKYLEDEVLPVANDIDRLLNVKITTLLEFISMPEFQKSMNLMFGEPLLDEDNVANRLEEMLKTNISSEDTLFIFERGGEQLLAVGANTGDVFISPFYWDTIDSMEKGEVIIIDVLIKGIQTLEEDDGSGTPLFYSFMITPYYPSPTANAKALVIVGLAFDPANIMRPAKTLIAESETSDVLLYSDAGRLLYTFQSGKFTVEDIIYSLPRNPEMSGWFESSSRGSKRIVGYAALKSMAGRHLSHSFLHCWYIMKGIDITDFQIYAKLTFWQTSLISFGLVALFCIVGLVISRRTILPLKHLNRSVQRITAGDLTGKFEVTSNDEIGVLAKNFNVMTERLRKMYKELADKIHERDRKATQITLINDITRAINTELDLQQTFRTMTSEIKKLVAYDRISICLTESGTNRAEFTYVEPEGRAFLPKENHIDLDNTNIGRAIETGDIIIKEDISLDKTAKEEVSLADEGMRSLIVIPLVSKNRIIGTLNLASKSPSAYKREEKELLLQISESLAVAIEHSRLYTRISRFAEELEDRIQERTRELERAQMKLLQAEKFSAAGQLAANVAHEINNPLQIIKNYLLVITKQIQKAQSQNPSFPLPTEGLKVINEELDRIANIIKSLLDFYRKPEKKYAPVNINSQITTILHLMKEGFEKHNIKIVLNLDDNLPRTLSSPDLIRQVLVNILRNAEDAMEKKGTLTISTRLTSGEDQEQSRIIVEIKDTGCGIKPEHMDKIFDPFFTTKTAEKGGTGLGLSVSYGIMHTLSGDIDIKSIYKKGTTVTLEFPLEQTEETAPVES